MKKFFAILLVVCMVFALAACGKTETPSTSNPPAPSQAPPGNSPAQGGGQTGGGQDISEPVRAGGSAGYITDDVDHFARAPYNFIYAYYDDSPLVDDTFRSFQMLESVYNFKVTRISGDESPETYMQNIEVLIDRGDVDGFFIDTDPQFQNRLLAVLNESGIPYMNMYTAFFDANGACVTPTVGLYQWQSGYDCMKWLTDRYMDYWGDVDTSTIGLLNIDFSVVPDLVERTVGIEAAFREAFPGNENVFVVDGLTGGTVSTEVGFDLTTQTVTANSHVQYWLVGSCLENYAQGAARAAEALHREHEFLITDVGSPILVSEWDSGYDGPWVTCYAIAQLAYVAPATLGLIAMADGRATKETLWENERAPGDVCTIWIAESAMVTRDTYREYLASVDGMWLGQ